MAKFIFIIACYLGFCYNDIIVSIYEKARDNIFIYTTTYCLLNSYGCSFERSQNKNIMKRISTILVILICVTSCETDDELFHQQPYQLKYNNSMENLKLSKGSLIDSANFEKGIVLTDTIPPKDVIYWKY